MNMRTAFLYPSRAVIALCEYYFRRNAWNGALLSLMYVAILNALVVVPTYAFVYASGTDGAIQVFSFVAAGALALMWLTHLVFAFYATIVFSIGALSAKPPREGRGYTYYENFIKTNNQIVKGK